MKHCILLILEGSNWSDSKQDCSSNWCSNSWSGTDCDWQLSSIIQQNRKIFFLIFRFLRFRRELVALLKMRESLASILSVFKRRGVRLRKQWNFHSILQYQLLSAMPFAFCTREKHPWTQFAEPAETGASTMFLSEVTFTWQILDLDTRIN